MTGSASASSSTTAEPSPPRVGVGIFLFANPTTHPQHAGKFLLGHRTGSLGAGKWALPGGHLEFGEGFEQCAARETEEETGLKVDVGEVRFFTATNSVMMGDNKHYVTVFVVGMVADGQEGSEPERREPERCLGWEWVRWEDLVGWAERGAEATGRRLFQPMRDLLVQRKGVVPSLG